MTSLAKHETALQAFEAAGFVVVRTPLLPLSHLLLWSHGLVAAGLYQSEVQRDQAECAWKTEVDLLRVRLRAIVERPEIAQALFIASPSLQTGIAHWKIDPDSRKGIKAEHALVRYFARMCARATPFGMFSGWSVGHVHSHSTRVTTLTLAPLKNYRPSVRLDFDQLCALTRALGERPALASELQYWPNTSLYRGVECCHYIESRHAVNGRTHHLVKVHRDTYVDAILERAQSGATPGELIETILGMGVDGIAPQDAEEYVQELIANELLVSTLSPLVTGPPPIDDLISQLGQLKSGRDAAQSLSRCRAAMGELEGLGLGIPLTAYDVPRMAIDDLLASESKSAPLYQVDMIKPIETLTVSSRVTDELLKGVEVVCRFAQRDEPRDLGRFRDAFVARYERARVPLLEALDEELGVGFGGSGGASATLTGALRLDHSDPNDKDEFVRVHPYLLAKVTECLREGRYELRLDMNNLPAGELPVLPDSFSVHGTLVASSGDAVDNGDFYIRWRGAIGPNGARFFGRFCHADQELEEHVRRLLREEEAHEPDAIFAEIVYLPEGRLGNVVCRPVFRDYEIVHLGRSGAPHERQIGTSDLLVAVENEQIVLYSNRLARRVIPRLTSAHNFGQSHLPSVYRFLGTLQNQQGMSVPGFSWGGLETLSFLPRLIAGRIVLSPARWRLTVDEVSTLTAFNKWNRFSAVQRLRFQKGLPRWVHLEQGDNSLLIDLDNALSVDAFVHVIKRGGGVILQEMYPTPDELCVRGPEGTFCHELNLPIVRRRLPDPSKHVSDVGPVRAASGIRTRPPGTEWLFVKVYGGPSSLDDVLTSVLPSLLERAFAVGVTRWFFVRYADPDEHLRLRFNGDADQLVRELMPLVAQAMETVLRTQRIWKIQFDTYEREIERYGGIEATDAAEDIFFADSDATLAVLQLLVGDRESKLRWQVAALGIDTLLSDCGFGLADKLEITRALCAEWYSQQKNGPLLKRQLAELYRRQRTTMQSLLAPSNNSDALIDSARCAFQKRSSKVIDAVGRLRHLAGQGELRGDVATIACSYVHMHVNRIVGTSVRTHELALYDLLSRWYGASIAQNRA